MFLIKFIPRQLMFFAPVTSGGFYFIRGYCVCIHISIYITDFHKLILYTPPILNFILFIFFS